MYNTINITDISYFVRSDILKKTLISFHLNRLITNQETSRNELNELVSVLYTERIIKSLINISNNLIDIADHDTTFIASHSYEVLYNTLINAIGGKDLIKMDKERKLIDVWILGDNLHILTWCTHN